MADCLLRALLSCGSLVLCLAPSIESLAARYTIAPSPPIEIVAPGIHASISLEPVYDVRGGTDAQDTVNFQVALGAGSDFARLNASIPLIVRGVGYGYAPNSVDPNQYYVTGDPLSLAHWSFGGFHPSPWRTGVLILVYDGGSIAALSEFSRALQVTIDFNLLVQVALPPVTLVSVSEPLFPLLLSASAMACCLRRWSRGQG